MPDETPPAAPPPDDWSFPPVEPAPPQLLGWTPEPALPDAPTATTSDDAPPEPPAAVEPAVEPGAEQPEDAPSAGVLPVPRRHAAAATPVSPLRALAGAAVAVAGVLLGIGALLWATEGPKGSPTIEPARAQSSVTSTSTEPTPSSSTLAVTNPPSPARATVVATTAPAAPKLALTVLNNSNRTGLAKRAAARFAAAGWPIRLTGAFRGRVTASTVYYAPGQQASALALQQQFPALERVRPRFPGLPGSGLTVVLIRSYPA